MSYIIEKKNPLVLTKLTAKGREKIAAGTLDWKYWSIGDSEIDYRYVNATGEPHKLLKPKDMQQNLKTLLEKESCTVLHEFSAAEKQVIECCVNNEAKVRGFFIGDDVSSMLIQTGETFLRNSGTVTLAQFNGTNVIDVGTVDFEDGDYILFKVTKNNVGVLDADETTVPVLYLWYKIEKTPLSTIITVDRLLPYFSFLNDVEVNFYIYPKGDSINEFYGTGSSIPYWHKPTLEFTADCDISQEDVCVLNQNNVWNESLAGTQLIHEGFLDFGSSEYLGQKEYLGYNIDCPEIVEDTGDCEDLLLSVDDDFVKGIGIIHFTNLNISNEYGEQYHIDHIENMPLIIKLPTVMWHRRDFGGSTNGNLLGMEFTTTGNTKLVTNSQIEYYDLVESPNLINATPISVGRVFPKLKIVTIHDEELLAVMSYKSSRNFTLPKMKGRMIFPSNGLGSGVLAKGKTMYMTYTLEADNGLRYFLPHQKYLKYNNTSKIDRDIEFTLSDTDLLPYMRQFENALYDGLGFYAHTFKILVQVVDNAEDRPLPENWTAIDYTSGAITNVNGYTINPLLLESQNPTAVGFTLTSTEFNSGSIYTLNVLNIPEVGCIDDLQFGDEVFFFGNMETNIGACIYRPLFKLSLDAGTFVNTTNPTWANGNPLWFSEIGVYDSQQELVAITKLSRPIEMTEDSKFALEFSLDF